MGSDSLAQRKAQLDKAEREHLEDLRERVEDNVRFQLAQKGPDDEPDDSDSLDEDTQQLVEYIDPFLVAEDQDLSKDAVDRVMMRRGKQTIYDDDGERIFPNREVGTISVERTHEERQFYEAVTEYVKHVYNRSEQLNEPAVGFAMALMQKRLVSSIGAIKATLSRRLANLVDQQSTATGLSEEASAYLEGEDLDEQDQQKAEEELAGLTITESDAQLEEEIETLRDLVSLAEGIPVDSKAQKVRRYIQQLLEEQPNEKVLLFKMSPWTRRPTLRCLRVLHRIGVTGAWHAHRHVGS